MATPSTTAVPGRVQGLRELKAAFQRLPEITRDALNDATETTVREIVRAAKARVQASPAIRTRALLNAITWKMNVKTGRGRAGVTAGSTTGFFAAGTGVAGELKRRSIKGVLVSRGSTAKLIRPSRYAHLVEFGARHMPAEPFMIPATESQKSAYLDRCRHAGKQIERDMAAVAGGGRTL